jgi:hypothetical protein
MSPSLRHPPFRKGRSGDEPGQARVLAWPNWMQMSPISTTGTWRHREIQAVSASAPSASSVSSGFGVSPRRQPQSYEGPEGTEVAGNVFSVSSASLCLCGGLSASHLRRSLAKIRYVLVKLRYPSVTLAGGLGVLVGSGLRALRCIFRKRPFRWLRLVARRGQHLDDQASRNTLC